MFRGGISDDQTGMTSGAWAKVELDTIHTDEDGKKYGENADLVDGKFKPSVEGYYQVNASIGQKCSPNATKTIVGIHKNGRVDREATGVYVEADRQQNSFVSTVIYLNGTIDYLELWGAVTSSGTCGIISFSNSTYLSAHLITGQSTGGGTGGDYTPEDIVWEDKLAERELDK